jgi:hypothetical protein
VPVKATAVSDVDSKVWGGDDLYVGGNGLIPIGQASSPTVTSLAWGLKSLRCIIGGKG